MKFLLKTITLIVVLSLAVCCFACSGEVYPEMNLQAEDELVVFDRGEQTLTVVASEFAERPTKFKSDISVSDIVIKEYLEGKTVSSVEYVDEVTIKVTMSGDTADFDGEWEVGLLVVSARACSIGVECYTYVRVYNTYISVGVGDYREGEPGNAYSEYFTEFTINNGRFSPDFDLDTITLVPYANFDAPSPSVNGKFVTKMMDQNKLIIRINYVDKTISEYPKVRIGAGLIEGSEAFEVEIGRSLDGVIIL